MGKPTFGEVSASIVDPMLSDNFMLIISNVPGSPSSEALRLQCRSAVKPGSTYNAVEVQVFGHTLEYAGNVTFSHDMSIDYVENRQAQVTKILEAWGQIIRDNETQTGAFKKDYARDGSFLIYDQKGTVVREYKIEAMWPTTIPDLSFDGSSSALITLSVSFKYDRALLVR
jgi:hypothetical protein